MAANSGISWTNDTFNPWIGCMKVGPACDGCYAEALMGMTGRHKRVVWGAPGVGVGTRSRTAPSNWNKVRTWNRQQEALVTAWEAAGRPGHNRPPPRYVFCASLADVFDKEVPTEWRRDLFDLIRETPHLTWMLLTKRPQLIQKLYGEAMLDPPDGGSGYPWPSNAAIGCTVVNQDEADRDIPHLLVAKAALNPAFAFVSMEPLLGMVDLTRVMQTIQGRTHHIDALRRGLDLVIVGGETDQGGHKARGVSSVAFRTIRDQCEPVGTAFHVKQWGEYIPADQWDSSFGLDIPPPDRFHTLPGVEGPQYRLGHKATGRLLDGVLHDAMPPQRELA